MRTRPPNTVTGPPRAKAPAHAVRPAAAGNRIVAAAGAAAVLAAIAGALVARGSPDTMMPSTPSSALLMKVDPTGSPAAARHP